MGCIEVISLYPLILTFYQRFLAHPSASSAMDRPLTMLKIQPPLLLTLRSVHSRVQPPAVLNEHSNSADSAPVEPGMRLGIIKNGNCTFGTGYVSLSRLSCFSPTNHALQLSIGSLLRTVEASGDSDESREMSSKGDVLLSRRVRSRDPVDGPCDPPSSPESPIASPIGIANSGTATHCPYQEFARSGRAFKSRATTTLLWYPVTFFTDSVKEKVLEVVWLFSERFI